MRFLKLAACTLALAGLHWPVAASAETARLLRADFPGLDLSRRSVNLSEIQSGGVPRDAIPAILEPTFIPVGSTKGLSDDEPVISISGGCGTFAFPYRILIWHEIVQHDLCGTPIAVTYCPLCNASVVFDRRVDGNVLSFGTSGRLRNSDLVMYDRQTQTLWQQFTGEAIVGRLTGRTLSELPARIESWRLFREAFPEGRVLVPPSWAQRAYGRTPYEGYDTAPAPFLYQGRMPHGIGPLERVVRVGSRAWSLKYVRKHAPVVAVDGLRIDWREGQNSMLDTSTIAQGRDIGNVRVTQEGRDVAYSVDFAFAYRAFYPNGELIR